jgi:ribosomal protein L7/L12
VNGMERDVVAPAREMLSNGHDIEAVVASLKQRGCSILESIKVVREITGSSLGDAKRVVHFSQAWAELRGAHENLHATLEATVAQEETISTGRGPDPRPAAQGPGLRDSLDQR